MEKNTHKTQTHIHVGSPADQTSTHAAGVLSSLCFLAGDSSFGVCRAPYAQTPQSH